MHTFTLGHTGLQPTRLAYGTWRLAGSEGTPAPPDAAALGEAAVLAAVEAGYTLFDLADIYGGGRCEEIFGQVLRAHPGLRERLTLVGKCGIRKPGTPNPGDPYRYDSSAEHLLRSVEGSLARLGIDALDVLLIHRPDYLMDPHEVADAFVRLRDAGKVRAFGVSNCRPSQIVLLQSFLPEPLVAHQVEISLGQLEALENGVLDQCLTEDITPMAWSPLARGALFGTHAASPHDALVREVMSDLALHHETTPAVIALAWLLRHPAKIVPVIGSIQPSRIRELVRADKLPLSREEWYRLLGAARLTRLP